MIILIKSNPESCPGFFVSGAALAYLVRFIQSLESLGTLILRLSFPLIGAYRAVVIDLWDACL